MKKLLLGLLIIILCFVLTGCNTFKTVEGNKEFGEYTGIYRLGKARIKIVQYKDKALVMLTKNNEMYGNATLFFNKNKLKDEDYKFEFKKNALTATFKNKAMPNGEYKRVASYLTETIYEDHVGDLSLLSNEYNGVYTNSENTIYTVQTSTDVIRIANYSDKAGLNIELHKENDNYFTADFFDDKYFLIYNGDKLDLKFESTNSENKDLTGIYTRDSKMEAKDIIRIFAFDDYMEE